MKVLQLYIAFGWKLLKEAHRWAYVFESRKQQVQISVATVLMKENMK